MVTDIIKLCKICTSSLQLVPNIFGLVPTLL